MLLISVYWSPSTNSLNQFRDYRIAPQLSPKWQVAGNVSLLLRAAVASLLF